MYIAGKKAEYRILFQRKVGCSLFLLFYPPFDSDMFDIPSPEIFR